MERKTGVLKESVDNRFYFMAPDGRFFDVEQDAIIHSGHVNSYHDYASTDALEADIQAMVKEVTYPVTRYKVDGSQSEGSVTFDTKTLDYRLAAAGGGATVIDGLSQAIFRLSDPDINEGSVAIHEGRYYLTTEPQPQDGFDNAWKNLSLSKEVVMVHFSRDSLPVEGSGRLFSRPTFLSAERRIHI